MKTVSIVSFFIFVMAVFSNCTTQRDQIINEQYTVEQYTEQLRLNPKNIDAYLGRARLYNLSGNYDEAIADCNEAIKLAPSNYWLYHERGRSNAFLSLEMKEYGIDLVSIAYAYKMTEDWKIALDLGWQDDRFMRVLQRDMDKYLE